MLTIICIHTIYRPVCLCVCARARVCGVYVCARVYDLCACVCACVCIRAPVCNCKCIFVRVWVSLGIVGHRVKIFGFFQLYLIIISSNGEITPIYVSF